MAWMSKALLPLDELSIKAELLLLWFQMQREARPLSGAIPGHGQRDVDGEDGNNLGRVTQITARPFLLVYIGVKLGECCALACRLSDQARFVRTGVVLVVSDGFRAGPKLQL